MKNNVACDDGLSSREQLINFAKMTDNKCI